MINAIDLSRLRSAEFIQFCKNFTSLVNTNNPTTLSVKPQYDAMMLKVNEMETLFKTVTSNPITTEIEVLDQRRDRAINGITGLIKNYCFHYDNGMVEAATALQSNLDLYSKGIASENYQSETAIINNLVTDWQTKPELQNAIDMLGLLEWTLELKMVNEIFDEKYLSRTQEYATASPDNLKSKRAEVMTAYYDLRKWLDAFSTIESSPLYTKTMNELNALIEQYNVLLTGRKPSKKTETTSSI